jgi:hypothetical protein
MPVNGTGYTYGDDIDVSVLVCKTGCTGPAGPCSDISATIYYRCNLMQPFTSVPMSYTGAVEDYDQFGGTIPGSHGCDEVEFYVEVVDAEDGETRYPPDDNGNDPNFFLPIMAPTSQDVVVTFQLCIPEGSAGGVCIAGSDPALGDWGLPGVAMVRPCPASSPNLYAVNATFLAGTNPSVQYRYHKDDCATEDCFPNHMFTIDDSQPVQILPVDGWCWEVNSCLECGAAVETVSWSTVKALYR